MKVSEIRTWERDVLLPLAQQRIELDLDDGVKINYLKFKGAVVPMPGLEKPDDERNVIRALESLIMRRIGLHIRIQV